MTVYSAKASFPEKASSLTISFRVVVERVKNAEFRDSAVMKNDLYQFISTIYLLYLCFFKAKQVTLDYPNSLNR